MGEKRNTALDCKTAGSMHFPQTQSNLNVTPPFHEYRNEGAKKLENKG
jgi:hypothetical protein